MVIDEASQEVNLLDLSEGVEAVYFDTLLGNGHIVYASKPTGYIGRAAFRGFERYVNAWKVASSAQTVVSVAERKIIKNSEINSSRGTANQTTFSHDGLEFSCDLLSRSDIDAINGSVSTNGVLPAAFPGAWKAANNTIYPIANVAAWNSFYDSMVTQGLANFFKSQNLKSQLASATTIEQINAITW